jgi:hypothetical protein
VAEEALVAALEEQLEEQTEEVAHRMVSKASWHEGNRNRWKVGGTLRENAIEMWKVGDTRREKPIEKWVEENAEEHPELTADCVSNLSARSYKNQVRIDPVLPPCPRAAQPQGPNEHSRV